MQVLRLVAHLANRNMRCVQVRPLPGGRPIFSLATDVKESAGARGHTRYYAS
jgi:hypothetical protein